MQITLQAWNTEAKAQKRCIGGYSNLFILCAHSHLSESGRERAPSF